MKELHFLVPRIRTRTPKELNKVVKKTGTVTFKLGGSKHSKSTSKENSFFIYNCRNQLVQGLGFVLGQTASVAELVKRIRQSGIWYQGVEGLSFESYTVRESIPPSIHIPFRFFRRSSTHVQKYRVEVSGTFLEA